MNAYNLNTHFGAYLFRENHFNANGVVGFMTLQVLDAYFDTSGKDTTADNEVLAICGCLSTPLKWQEFDNEWQPYLKSEGFPPDAETGRYVFHTSTFWATDNRPEPEKNRIYLNLIKIIAKHTVFRFGYIVLLKHFRRLEAEIPHLRELLSGKPGTFMSEICFMRNSGWAEEKGYNPSISYISDRGDEFWGELIGKYHFTKNLIAKGEYEIPEGEQRNVASLTCGNKAKYSGIQAADIIAWENLRRVIEHPPSVFASASKPSPKMALLETPGASEFHLFDKRALRRQLERKFASALKEVDLKKDAVNFIGEGKPFKSMEELMIFKLKNKKEKDVKLHKERQAEAKEKKKL